MYDIPEMEYKIFQKYFRQLFYEKDICGIVCSPFVTWIVWIARVWKFGTNALARVDSTGSMAVVKTCPIEVTKELLIFDISEFPAKYYYEREEYLAYTGRVTAEYTFYNPTDLTLTATIAFPFGNQPDYASIYDEKIIAIWH